VQQQIQLGSTWKPRYLATAKRTSPRKIPGRYETGKLQQLSRQYRAAPIPGGYKLRLTCGTDTVGLASRIGWRPPASSLSSPTKPRSPLASGVAQAPGSPGSSLAKPHSPDPCALRFISSAFLSRSSPPSLALHCLSPPASPASKRDQGWFPARVEALL
jgi:hypothetical protein